MSTFQLIALIALNNESLIRWIWVQWIESSKNVFER